MCEVIAFLGGGRGRVSFCIKSKWSWKSVKFSLVHSVLWTLSKSKLGWRGCLEFGNTLSWPCQLDSLDYFFCLLLLPPHSLLSPMHMVTSCKLNACVLWFYHGVDCFMEILPVWWGWQVDFIFPYLFILHFLQRMKILVCWIITMAAATSRQTKRRRFWSAQGRGCLSPDTLGTGKRALIPSSWPAMWGSTYGIPSPYGG